MFHDVSITVIGGLILSIILAITVAIGRWFRNMRKLIAYAAKQMTNDGNGTWRSNIDDRLTAIEMALPGVTPKPEHHNNSEEINVECS